MKKYLLITTLAVLAFAPFSILQAQYEIPSYDVELTGSSVTFEEDHDPGYTPDERRKLKVRVADESPSTIASATILVYVVDNSSILGPYTVREGTDFITDIDELEWGIEVISYSADADLSAWIE